MGTFQILPTLSSEDYVGLKESIRLFGVQVPVEYDDAGNIIDGHHRVRACQELGIADWPRITRPYTDDKAKRTQARELNFRRRHMSRDVLRALIAEELKENPVRSDRQVAEKLGVSHHTVNTIRADMEAGGQIAHHDEHVGKDGVSQPAKKRAKAQPAPEVEPKKRNAPAATWIKVKVPDGETLETMVRRGLAQEADGTSPEDVAKSLGIGILSYRHARDIVILATQRTLRREDREPVARALIEINATSQLVNAWEIVAPIALKVWGEDRAGQRTREGVEKYRRDLFDRAMGALVQICSSASEIEIPYLLPEQAAEVLAELTAAEKSVREFKSKLKELTND
jgi:hypothetical protein